MSPSLAVQQEEPEASTSSLTVSVAEGVSDVSESKLLKKKSKKKLGEKTPGIVYISRIPPGMTPQKIKHLMGRWGEIGKVYAQKADASSSNSKNKGKGKEHSVRYTEAWVEFLDKSIAKSAAELLNAQLIGGGKGERWRDDIWTMKYLSGFRWEMLGEQVAYERASHTARLRQELSKSKAEQSEYLRNVELARVLEKRNAKKRAAGEEIDQEKEQKKNKGERSYKQRTLVGSGVDGSDSKRQKATASTGGGMDALLNQFAL